MPAPIAVNWTLARTPGPAKLYVTAKHENKPFDPHEFGFDFSNDNIEDYLKGVHAVDAADEFLKSHPRAA